MTSAGNLLSPGFIGSPKMTSVRSGAGEPGVATLGVRPNT